MAKKKNEVVLADLSPVERSRLLLSAIHDEDPGKFKAVLATEGLDVDIQTAGGYTPLMLLAYRGDVEGMKLLIAAGASVNQVEGAKSAPLMAASTVEAIQVLLDAGAGINACSENGWTALMAASKRGDPEGVALLLQLGANVNAATDRGRTALICAADEAKGTKSRRCMELLVEAGANVNAKTDLGWTALRSAVKAEHAECIKYLLSVGADANAESSHGLTALTSTKNMAIARMLLEHDGSPNAADNDKQRTALIRAAFDGNLSMVELLLEQGANPNIADSEGSTALLSAAAYKDIRAMYRGFEMDPRLPVIEALIRHGANVNAADRRGWTALMLVAREGHLKTVDCLLGAGADPLPSTVRGRNAFLVAATPEIARKILDALNATPEGAAIACAGAKEVADRLLGIEVKQAIRTHWREHGREPTEKQQNALLDQVSIRLSDAVKSPDYSVILECVEQAQRPSSSSSPRM